MKSTTRFATQAVLLTFAGVSLSAFAFQPLITDDMGTQGAGGNQLEFSFNEDRAKAAGDTVRVQELPLVYTRGLTESIDVFTGMGYIRIPGFDTSGNGNPALGAKWRFYEDEDYGTSFAIKPEIVFPVSARREDSGLGTGNLSGNLTLILTQQAPFGALHANLGIGRDRFNDTLNNSNSTTFHTSMAPIWESTSNGNWRWIWERNPLAMGTVHCARISSNWVQSTRQTRTLDFALGIVRRSDNDSPHTRTNSVTAGITWRFQ